MVRYYKLLLAVSIVFLCNNWLLTPLLNPHMSSSVSLISEISALSQPYHWVFQVSDITAGVLILSSVPWLLRGLRRRQYQWPLLLGGMIIGVGLDSIIDALLPISCAPSVDAHCQLATTHSLIPTHI